MPATLRVSIKRAALNVGHGKRLSALTSSMSVGAQAFVRNYVSKRDFGSRLNTTFLSLYLFIYSFTRSFATLDRSSLLFSYGPEPGPEVFAASEEGRSNLRVSDEPD